MKAVVAFSDGEDRPYEEHADFDYLVVGQPGELMFQKETPSGVKTVMIIAPHYWRYVTYEGVE